jgi:hypothetical protein
VREQAGRFSATAASHAVLLLRYRRLYFLGSGSLSVRAGSHVAGVARGVLITAFAIMTGVRF